MDKNPGHQTARWIFLVPDTRAFELFGSFPQELPHISACRARRVFCAFSSGNGTVVPHPNVLFLKPTADAVNNAAGFGFSGVDKDGRCCWDLLSNLNIWKIEVSEFPCITLLPNPTAGPVARPE